MANISHWQLFRPILAGASLRDRLIACAGAALGIAIVTLAGLGEKSMWPTIPYLFAPIGASAVLVFALPASPLSQPWPVVGGNIVSALVGVAAVHWIGNVYVAGALAVGGAILAMSLLRCLHAPGGGTALVAILGGPSVTSLGFAFPFTVVAVNAAALVAAAWLFHRFSGHAYPHRAAAAPAADFLRSDIERALAETGETFDIDPADLEALLMRAEEFANHRRSRR